MISVRDMFFKCYSIHKWNTWKTISGAKHDDVSGCEVGPPIDEKWIWPTDLKKKSSTYWYTSITDDTYRIWTKIKTPLSVAKCDKFLW